MGLEEYRTKAPSLVVESWRASQRQCLSSEGRSRSWREEGGELLKDLCVQSPSEEEEVGMESSEEGVINVLVIQVPGTWLVHCE